MCVSSASRCARSPVARGACLTWSAGSPLGTCAETNQYPGHWRRLGLDGDDPGSRHVRFSRRIPHMECWVTACRLRRNEASQFWARQDSIRNAGTALIALPPPKRPLEEGLPTSLSDDTWECEQLAGAALYDSEDRNDCKTQMHD
jgi:hypothetical protein